MDNEEQLVPVFMPALAALLVRAESLKGAALTENEVVRIRDNSTVMMVRTSVADSMDASRGYRDVDPENVWQDWQMLRREMA